MLTLTLGINGPLQVGLSLIVVNLACRFKIPLKCMRNTDYKAKNRDLNVFSHVTLVYLYSVEIKCQDLL